LIKIAVASVTVIPYRPLFVGVTALVLLSSALCLAGCGAGGYGCSASVERAIEVDVLDAVTGRPIADGASGTLRDGSFSEAMPIVRWKTGASPEMLIPVALGGANERQGTYTVRVEREGYSPWEARNVRVDRGPCHVNTRRLEARLQPLP
jgi:hypothetical protein